MFSVRCRELPFLGLPVCDEVCDVSLELLEIVRARFLRIKAGSELFRPRPVCRIPRTGRSLGAPAEAEETRMSNHPGDRSAPRGHDGLNRWKSGKNTSVVPLRISGLT